VLLFGGGYNPNKDTHPGHKNANGEAITETQKGSNDTGGNAFFIVNADTGELIWKAIKGTGAATNRVFQHPNLTDSIPSEVTAVDTNGNQLIDRAYFGDTGGRLWRVDLYCHDQTGDATACPSFCENSDGSDCSARGWKVTPLLSVGRHYNDALQDDRRFFYAPDFVRTKDSAGRYDAIILGTGDRENPKDTAVKNWFYMYKDRYVQTNSIPDAFTTVVHSDSELGDVSDDCLQTGTCSTSPNLNKGWKMRLRCQLSTIDNTCGEKNLAPAVTLSGTIFFTTYLPPGISGTACTLPEGNGLFYEVSLQQGLAVEDFFAGNGETLDWRDRATILASGGIPAEVVSLGGSGSHGDILRPDLSVATPKVKNVFKTFWYEKYLK
jgi:type IV pilus assembly protein PilY1